MGPNRGQTVFHFDDRDREYRQRYVHVRLLEEGHTDDADDQRVGEWSAPFLLDAVGDVYLKLRQRHASATAVVAAQVRRALEQRRRSFPMFNWCNVGHACAPPKIALDGGTLFTTLTPVTSAAPFRVDNWSPFAVSFHQSCTGGTMRCVTCMDRSALRQV